MSKEINYGDYCKVRIVENPEALLIAFSGVNTKKGSFNYYSSLKKNNVNQIFLNTTLEKYYMGSLEGIGSDFNTTIESLNLLITQLSKGKTLKTYCIGCSMGGYGALLLGSILNVDFIYAFSPSGPPFSETLIKSEFKNRLIKEFELYKPIILNSDSKKYLVYGDRTANEFLAYFNYLDSKNSISFFCKDYCHAIIYPLSKIMSIHRFIEYMVSMSGDVDFSIFFESTYNLPKESYDFYKKYGLFLLANQYYSDEELDIIADKHNGVLGEFYHFNLFLGKMFFFINNHEKAKIFLKKSIDKYLTPQAAHNYNMISNKSERLALHKKTEKFFFKNIGLFKYDQLELQSLTNLRNDLRSLSLNENIQQNLELLPQNYRGYVDKFDGKYIYGWCHNNIDSNDRVELDIFVGSEFIGNTICNLYRSDLERTKIGNDAKHSFQYEFCLHKEWNNIALKKNQNIEVFLHNTKSLLTNGILEIKPPIFKFNIEDFSKPILKGWFYDENYPETNLSFDLVLNKTHTVTVTTDIIRHDVNHLSKPGFTVDINLLFGKDVAGVIEFYETSSKTPIHPQIAII